MIFDETFHRHPAIGTLVPIIHIIRIRTIVSIETIAINRTERFDLDTDRITIDTTTHVFVGNVVVIVIIVDQIHFIALLNFTDQCSKVIAFLDSVIEHNVKCFANRNAVNEEFRAILVRTNTVRRNQRYRTIASEPALDHQVLDFLRRNIVALGCKSVTGICIRNSNRYSERIPNFRRCRRIAVLHSIRVMDNLIFRQSVIPIRFSNTVIAIGIETGQIFASIAVSIRTRIGFCIQRNDIVVGDVINIDVIGSLFADCGIEVGIVNLNVVRVNDFVRIVILLSRGIAGHIHRDFITSEDRFVEVCNGHGLSIVPDGFIQVQTSAKIVGVSVIRPGVFLSVMVETVNIQRTRIDRAREIMAADIVVVVRVVDKRNVRQRLDTVESSMDLFGEFLRKQRRIIRGTVIAISCRCVELDRITVYNTTVSRRILDLDVFDLGSGNVVVDTVIVGAVQIQWARINVEIHDISGSRYRSICNANQLLRQIRFTGCGILPLEGNIILTCMRGRSSIGIGRCQRIAVAIRRCIGRVRNIIACVVGVNDAYGRKHVRTINTRIAFVSNERSGYMQRRTIVSFVRNRQQYRRVFDTDTAIIVLMCDVHGVFAYTAQQTLIQVNNTDRSRTVTASRRTSASQRFSGEDLDLSTKQGRSLPSNVVATTRLSITGFSTGTGYDTVLRMQFGNTAVPATATATRGIGSSAVLRKCRVFPSTTANLLSTRDLKSAPVLTTRTNCKRSELGALTAVIIAGIQATATSAATGYAKYSTLCIGLRTVIGQATLALKSSRDSRSATATTATGVSVSMPGRAIGRVADMCADPSRTAAVITANTLPRIFMSVTAAICTGAASNKVEGCAFFNIGSNDDFAALAAF